MALRFIEGFDHYTTEVQQLTKWTATSSGPTIQAGRNGNGIAHTDVDESTIVIDAAGMATVIAGFAVTFNSLGGVRFFALEDAGTIQLDLRMNGGLIQLTRNGTVLATLGWSVSLFQWYYFELKATINNSGSYELRINENTELSASGVDTQSSANAFATGISIGQTTGASGAQTVVDDLYVCDGTGSAPTNDFLGDCRVECLFPNGNGNASNFDGSDGNSTDNYLLTDEATPDDETTYVESPDVGDKDTYTYGNLVTASGTVYAVAPIPRARKTDAGSKTFVSVARLSGTEADSSAQTALDTYIYRQDIRETKPGGGAWTIADVNSSEFGIKVAS